MEEILGEFKDDYMEFTIEDNNQTTGFSRIYRAINKKKNRECCLKVISKEKIKRGDYKYFLERLRKEQKIQALNSIYTVNFYRRLETEDYIIFELEYCDDNLYNYLQNNGELSRKKNFFKEIVISIAKALKALHEKGIIHRDIKPHNIFIKSTRKDNTIIKLGNFSSAIRINENKSYSFGTPLYSAPEIAKDLYEKVDLWSLGITLYELYFGVLPYGPNADKNAMMNAINGEKFILKKTFKKNEQPEIPTLDILFKRLLTIKPENRMTYEEFFDYVFSDDFMKEGVIAVNNNSKYKKIFEDILSEEFIDYKEKINKVMDLPKEKEESNNKKLISFIKEGNIPDILKMDTVNNDKKFNNIIYYNSNINDLNPKNIDIAYFERYTSGAFILCTNMDSFKLLRTEILSEIKGDKRITFNILTSGTLCDNVMEFLNEDPTFKSIIKNLCVYCSNIKKWCHLKNKYELVYEVVNSPKEVINFIKNCSSEEIKPYHVTKLITFNDYLEKYKDIHFKISQFYGDLKPETFKVNIEKMRSLIIQEKNERKLYTNDQNKLYQSFLTFDLTKDLENLDKLIIKEYTKNTFYADLNKWLWNSHFNSFVVVAYFTSRLMYSLNKYAKLEEQYLDIDGVYIYRGIKLLYSNILPYENSKGKIILFPAFTTTVEDLRIAEMFSGRKSTQSLYNYKKRFSVIFYIKNNYKKNWISNGIKIQNISVYKNEKEVLFQPFSFYYVKDVQIDLNNYKADIYLETIGKKEILEEQIQKGKEIKYNEKEGIMEVK